MHMSSLPLYSLEALRFKKTSGLSLIPTDPAMPTPKPEIEKLGQLLAQIEDHEALQNAMREIHAATKDGKMMLSEALQILQIGYDQFTKSRGILAKNVMNVGYLWALVECQPKNTPAIQALACEQIERGIAFDFGRAQLVRTSKRMPSSLQEPERKLFLRTSKEILPSTLPPKEIRAQRVALEKKWVEAIEDLTTSRTPVQLSQELGKVRLQLALLSGSSHCQAALEVLKDAPAKVTHNHEWSLAYQRSAAHAAGSESPAWAVLTLRAGRQELAKDPNSALLLAPSMIIALCRLSRLCPQTVGKQGVIIHQIEELIRQVMNRKHNPQPEDIMTLFQDALKEVTHTQRDSLFHLLLELSATKRQLRFYPADDEAAQKLGYLQACLAYKEHRSVGEIVAMAQQFIGKKGPGTLSDSQKEDYLLGMIGGTPEGSPERTILEKERDLFREKIDPEHRPNHSLRHQAEQLQKNAELLLQRPPTFHRALAEFLQRHHRRRLVVRHQGTLPPTLPPPLPDIQ